MKNLVEKWTHTDKKLYDLITTVQSSGRSPVEQAEMIFNRISELYNIPKTLYDISEDDSEESENALEPRCLFEEHALVKFLADEDEDPMCSVISAAYNLLNDIRVDYHDVAVKEFGDNIPVNCQIAIKGLDYFAEVVFPQKEGKNWCELGCFIVTEFK